MIEIPAVAMMLENERTNAFISKWVTFNEVSAGGSWHKF
jgi:hypothetical protein